METVEIKTLQLNISPAQPNIMAQVETRFLPRELIYLNIRHNKIFGAFNLSTLPSKMQVLIAMHNEISSIVSLTYLPLHVERIGLSANKIRSKFEQKFYTLGKYPLLRKASI